MAPTNQGQGNSSSTDDLSAEERQQIQEQLGISGDMVGSDEHGKDAYLLLQVPDFGEPSFPNTDDALFPEQTHQPQGASTVARRLQSFLRLGAFDINQEPASAKKLLKLIHQAGPPGNPVRGDNTTSAFGVPTSAGGTAAFDPENDSFLDAPPFQPRNDADKKAELAGNRDVVFIDDVRVRPQDVTDASGALLGSLGTGDDPGHGLTMKRRQEESARLYARGGWRDHSDGNRISTTYGDKVEVVRGNYKMIVMGRQDDPGEAMGWEASGSHIQDYAPGTMPGASYWLEWVPNYQESGSSLTGSKGVWLLVNTTENVYEYARNAGHFREEKWGDLHESYVGSENPPAGQGPTATEASGSSPKGTAGHTAPATVVGVNYNLPRHSDSARHLPPWEHDDEGVVRSNPHIVEKTWATRIDSWTGSSACRVPIISEQTWAEAVEEEMHCTGTVLSTTHAGAVNEREAIGAKASSTITSSVAETLVTAGVLNTTVVLGLEVETKYVTGAITTNIIGVNALETKLATGSTTIELVGDTTEIKLFAKSVEAAIGVSTAFKIGASVEFQVGKHETVELPEKKEITLSTENTSIKQKHMAINWSSDAVQSELKAVQAKIAAAKTDIGTP